MRCRQISLHMKTQLKLLAACKTCWIAFFLLAFHSTGQAGVVPPSVGHRSETLREPQPVVPVFQVEATIEQHSEAERTQEQPPAATKRRGPQIKYGEHAKSEKKLSRGRYRFAASAKELRTSPQTQAAPALKIKLLRPLLKIRAQIARTLDALGILAPNGRGSATTGFVFGLIGLIFVLTFFLAPIGVVFSIVGLIFSLFGLEETMGVVGLVLSIIGLVLGLLFSGIWVLAFAST